MEAQARSKERLRLADLLAALSLVTDLGMGQPSEAAMRACLLAIGLARRMGLGEAGVADIYYTTLLKYVGCTAYAHEEAVFFGGDDITARAAGAQIDFGNPREALSYFLFDVARDAAPVRRVSTVAGALYRTARMGTELERSHCEVASGIARRLRLPSAVQQGLYQVFERWDGKGAPQKLKGDDVALPARFAQLAAQVVIFDRLGGPEVAMDVVRRRSGTWLDPSIAAAFLQHGRSLLTEIASTDVMNAVVAAEPEPRRWIPETDLDEVARVFGDMADLKLSFTRGHSAGVAELAERAGCLLRFADVDVISVRRAGHLHDLGRVSVPNGTWERPGPLMVSEWELVRLHAYHSERILSCSPALASLAPLAGLHHERLDGSGYHRQATATALPISARVLAAADVYQAMTQDRPHRSALSPDTAADQLRDQAAQGRLDTEAVGAVLAAAGHKPARQRRDWPAGLSDREVEVLRLIARGYSAREVARDLYISPKTAGHHIEHIYAKIGVSTRAAAAMFAMEHDLLPR